MSAQPAATAANAVQTRRVSVVPDTDVVQIDGAPPPKNNDPRGIVDEEIQSNLERQASPAPSNANQITVSGHGVYYRSEGTLKIPANTYITIYIKEGQIMLSGTEAVIIDGIGEGFSSPDDVKKLGLTPITLEPGAEMPDITISRISDNEIKPGTNPYRVSGRRTLLSSIVHDIASKKRDFGIAINIHIATCFSVRN